MTLPTFRTTALLASFALASCSAPISFQRITCKTPKGDYNVSPLSDALRELKTGKSCQEPTVASGHFFESARLAGELALKGESGALALYNQACGLLVEKLNSINNLPWGRTITIGSGNTQYSLSGKLEAGAPAGSRDYVNVDSLKFDGIYASIRATRPGIGAPLVAASQPNKDFRKTYDLPQSSKALTALLRFKNTKSATLELYNPLEVDKISIAGRNPQLAADFSAPVSMMMSIARPDKLGITRLLDPQKYSDTARLIRIQDYDKNRTPVLFVHGLNSTPATWSLMYHHLMQDEEIRKKYQFWFFSYPSGYPYPYSASLLRKELNGVNQVFPDHKPMIIVGHSMGGMISRLMVTDPGDAIWRSMFKTPPSETPIQGASRKLLEDALVFENRKDIHNAIFIAAPHRGSELSNNFVGRMFSRLVRLPNFITDTRNVFASLLTADAASLHLDSAPNSIDTLSPNNRFVREINKLPIAPKVTYHSIMGDRGKGDTPNSSDGVVPYWSSHLEGAASEKIVPSGHGAHENPQGLEEVRRILKLKIKSLK